MDALGSSGSGEPASAALRDLARALSSSIRDAGAARYDRVWLGVALVLATAVRAYPLRQRVSYDEAYTFLNFAQHGFPAVLHYPVPNNHVLHTLLVWLSTSLLGPHLVTIRIPAFVAGVAAVPLIFWLCRALLPRGAGYLATAAACTLHYLVYYSDLARGYSLVVALSVALAFVGIHVVRRPSRAGCAVLALIAALGMLTIPTMLFAIAGVYLWLGSILLIERRSFSAALHELVVPCVAMTAILTALFYLPVAIASGGLKPIVANPFVLPLPWDQFAARLRPHVGEVLRQFTWGVPRTLVTAGAVLILVGIAQALRERHWPVVVLIPAMAIGSCAVLVLKQSIPFTRTWIFAIPFALVAADMGCAYLMRVLPPLWQGTAAALLIALAIRDGLAMSTSRVIASGADFPHGPRLIRTLRSVMNADDTVEVRDPISWPAYYYMWAYGVPDPQRHGPTPQQFFIVDRRFYEVGQMTSAPVTSIARFGDMELFRAR